ncbi:Transposase Tnp1/En/Spm-like [Arabidopsis thaliana x Arabidopsis arenosa]|uniref:Transposase Tnp1/En/Spm-like n=1 Tax=Arabidopsis thaliana x Arabidopsis arenosa TaxID=1240361 RepID=A0A8T2A6A3_9BRAS|nr:Transposase Tnp1/En/Spm-like [Arabidopsis thaliana x Arabidopsis arenosa]
MLFSCEEDCNDGELKLFLLLDSHDRADPGYERGARKFVRDVAAVLGDIDMIICPCKDCRNVERQSGSDVVVHLVTKGMDEAYKMQGDWYHHGDVNSVAEGDSSNVNDWNEEILELYKAAEFFDEELASQARLGDIPEAELAEIAEDEVIVAEGRWQTQEPSALVNGLPLGPKAVKVFVDSVHQPDTFIWRPTMEKSPLQKSASTDRPSSSKSSAETKSAATEGKAASTVSKSPATGSDSPIEDAGVQSSPIKKSLPNPQSPLRKSQRINQLVSKENKKCKLMDITGKKRVVAEGRWATNDPAQKVHFVPLGPDAVKVWVDIVKVSDASVWRPNEEIAIMEDALGTVIAWPEDKVIMS